MDTKFERLLNLVALLDSHDRPLTAEEIRTRLGAYADNDVAFRRTFERDKEDLLAMGIPLRSVTEAGPHGDRTGYALDRSVADPGLTPAELAGLRVAAARLALRDERPDDLKDPGAGLRKLGGMPRPNNGPSLAQIHLDHVVSRMFEAITSGRSVEFTHLGTARRLLPRRLLMRRGHWYVAGFDLDRDEPRNFRLDRIEGGVALAEQRPGEGEVPLEALRLRPWEFGSAPAVTATVLLDREIVPLALTQDPDLPVTEVRDDGATVVALEVRSPKGLWDWLIGFLDRAELLGPEELRARWIAELEVLAGAGDAS